MRPDKLPEILDATGEPSIEPGYPSEDAEFWRLIPELVKTTANNFSDLPRRTRSTARHLERWMKQSINHEPARERMLRGKFVVMTYAKLNPPQLQNTRMIHIMGWIVEMLSWQIEGDMMDFGQTSPEDPRKYAQPPPPDPYTHRYLAFRLLKYYFEDYIGYRLLYKKLVELIDNATFGNALEQLLEEKANKNIFGSYNMKDYNEMVEFKHAYINVTTPVVIGLTLAGKCNDFEVMKRATKITGKIGYYFKTRDDFNNCYGVEWMAWKPCTDIQDRKCTWLFCKAAELARQKDQYTLWKNYGRNKKKSVKLVKKVYEDLGVNIIYTQEEQKMIKEILELVFGLEIARGTGAYSLMFTEIIDKLYRKSDFWDGNDFAVF